MKNSRLFRLTAVLVFCVCALCLAFGLAGNEPAQGIFYRITGGKNEMFVLGSIHIGSDEMYPMSNAIQDALQDAELLVFECDTQSEDALTSTGRLMRYQGEETLSACVSTDCRKRLAEVAAKLGYDMSALEMLKPWAIVSMLSMETMAAELGTKNAARLSELGVENAVRNLADGKLCIYLETVEEQLGMMDSFSPALQEYLLQGACEVILNGQRDEDLKLWPEWWAKGEAQAFADSYLKGLAQEKEPALAQEYHQALISKRNEQMSLRLAQLLESTEGNDCFVTVGLMHLVLPDDSILSHLEKMGYGVQRIAE